MPEVKRKRHPADISGGLQGVMAYDQHDPYRESAISHADPVKLVELMYEGAIKFIHRARKGIAGKDPEGAHNNILRAYAIVAELMATLDFEGGGEIAEKLEQCYDYVLHLLKEADIKKESRHLDKALTVIEPMLGTWKEAFPAGKLLEKEGDPVVSIPATNGEQEQATEETPKDRKTLDVVG